MKNLKLKVIIGGILGITIISIILALTLDCVKYGVYIAFGDVAAIFMWILVGNYLVNDYQKTVDSYKNIKK